MTIEEIVHGESKNVEFKEMLPDKSEKYIKTVIAFANTQGGRLIVGVNDETRKVTGVDMDSVFKIMDSITNAVSDSCTPQIVPDITFQTMEDKTVVVVSIAPGVNRPYYMKSKGKEDGTYIRVAGTSRQADLDKIKELELEGARVSWDELTCVGHEVKENAIKKLCRDMNRYRNKMQERKGNAEKLPQVTRAQLLNWNVIRKTEDGYLASNAFALLTGKHFHYSKTQCAVFAGTDRGEFIDKREYDGPLYEQIEEAYAFVLRNIRRGARVEGLIRRESHELPPGAIREMIINAHCHRNFLDTSCVQVALYDDRLEVTSPGGLCYGLTLEEALSGRSKQRNRIVAEVFSQMGLIEAWGTGLRNIRKAAEEYSLPEPQFVEMPGTFRVNLFRNLSPMEERQKIGKTSVKERQSIGKTSVKERQGIGETSVKERQNIGIASVDHRNMENAGLNATQQIIINLLSENVQMGGTELAERIGISKRNIETNIKKLKEKGVLIRHGSARGGYWEIVGKMN